MSILIRNEKTDLKVRVLARRARTTLQGAVDLAVENELKRREIRRRQIEEATRKAQALLAGRPMVDDGLTHKEFFDREYGDA